MLQMSAYHVGQLVDKMANPDKDFRFMACNDLMKDLKLGTITLEDDSTAKVMRALIRLLNDTNGEVQNLAIKCIGLLASPSKIKSHHLEQLVEELIPHVFSKNEQSRDIHALTLKSMIANMPPASANKDTPVVIKRMLPKFLESINTCPVDDAARIDVLDLIGEILLRFGEDVPHLHPAALKVMTDHLYSGRSAIRKKATTGLGHLASVINSTLYDELVINLLAELSKKTVDSSSQRTQVRTLVVALSTIARASGSKFSKHTAHMMPHLLRYLDVEEDSDNDDLREAALQGLEVFLYRSPQEVSAFQADVIKHLTKALRYDPNYEYGDDEEEDEMEDDENEDDDDYSDDEDVTWKVRRAAAKAMEAMVASHRESILYLAQTLGPIIIGRFKEREETVRTEIISVYIALLNQISLLVPDLQKAIVSSDEDSIETDDVVVIGGIKFSTHHLSGSQVDVIKMLGEQKASLLKAIVKSLKRHPKSGAKCIELLSALIRTHPTFLEDSLDEVIPAVASILTEKNASAQGKMVVLAFISKALVTNEPRKFQKLLTPLTAVMTQSISDSFYKVCAEGLSVSSKYVEVLRVLAQNGGNEEAKKLLVVIVQKFMSNETDQEVREKSISAISTLMSAFKDQLKPETPAILEKMTERIGREMTCLMALRASSQMVAVAVSPQLQFFLYQNNVTKISIVFQMTCLVFVEKLMKHTPASSIPDEELTQGPALQSLLSLFSAIVKTDFDGKPTFENLLDTVTSPVYDNLPLSRHSHLAIASCAAVITESTQSLEKSRALAKKLAQQLQVPTMTDSIRLFAMITLGELGRRVPETYAPDFPVQPEDLAIRAFNNPHEDLKAAAAQTLGALAVGNLTVYLPFILNQIKTQPKKQYLLLHALKEAIVWESSLDEGSKSTAIFRSAIGDIWGMLMANAGGSEDGTRSVVAECLGRLCSFDPETLLPQLKEHMKSQDPTIRAAVVSAIKYMINDDKRSVDVSLQKYIKDFLQSIRDPDLKVRRVGLVVLNSAAHNKSALIRDLLPELLPHIYEETKLRKELIKEVEMGPFKHLVDEVEKLEELKKAVIRVVYMLKTKLPELERHPQYLDLYNTIKHNKELESLSEDVLRESQRAVVYDTPMETI
ncbi:Protein CBR-CAND-1 [Caenorhabditis briggsae]|uniref:Protein CBR-CAND-1 n=1 Tax=Caenorhabditis briggsae TaxID=6238 RepID=A8WJJ0_CAEBR|nr:Protein CBR-CAND-1 [Caenorhabditis briggsae]CAP20633.2 Protein CBR-CAND-1 [Caenorhabditis briggsae]